jgi:transcription initiation factor TFIID TATA-box-binding protein
MSQEEIQEILYELGGQSTQQKISKFAKEQHPNRTLSKHSEKFLKKMLDKGLVKNNNNLWFLTNQGLSSEIDHKIAEIDTIIDGETLIGEYGVTISNLVGSIRINKELDLEYLNKDLKNTEYNPEIYPSMIYRPNVDTNISILTPRTGRLAIVGGKSKSGLIRGVRDFFNKLSNLDINIKKSTSDILIQNIVANFDVGHKIDLSTLSIALGLENIEYEPEQFPGIVYRRGGNSTILIFSSGKLVIAGAKSYLEIVQKRDDIIKLLLDNGFKIDSSEYNMNNSPKKHSDNPNKD